MKKILILFALVFALEVNASAYSSFFTLSGDAEITSPVFKVRVSAQVVPKPEGDTTDADADTADVSDEPLPNEDGETAQPEETDENTDTEAQMPADSTFFEGDVSEETAEPPSTDGAYGVLGGEGTVVFDKTKLELVSASVCAPDGMNVFYSSDSGFCRFMFYSEEIITGAVPVLDLEFKVLSAQGNVSVIISEGKFSNGTEDTPAENVSFTSLYTSEETVPVTAPPTVETSVQTDAEATETSPVETVYTETEAITSAADTTEQVLTNEQTYPSTEGIPPTQDDPSSLPLIIVVTAVAVSAVAAAVILITKKAKSNS